MYFFQSLNGLSLLRGISNTSPDFTIYTSASGLWGCSTCFSTQWLQWQWPSEWLPISIMAKKLVPVVLSCAVWGPQLAGCPLLFRCYNCSVVVSVNKEKQQRKVMWCTSSDAYGFFIAYYDISFLCEHITCRQNDIADHISCDDLQTFFCLNPQASSLAIPVPRPFQQLLALPGSYWQSQVVQAHNLWILNLRQFRW